MPDSTVKCSARGARRAKAVAGLITGKNLKTIAAGEGVSARTIQRDLKAPEARLFVASLVDIHRQEVEAIFARCLQRINEGLDAIAPVVVGHVQNKPIYEERTDHRNRLDAVRRFIELMRLAGDQQAAAPEVPTNPLENLTWKDVQRHRPGNWRAAAAKPPSYSPWWRLASGHTISWRRESEIKSTALFGNLPQTA